MTYEELKAKTKAMADAAHEASGDGAENVGFVLLTVANEDDGHLIFSATNLDRDTALYLASMADDVMAQSSSDAIGAVMGNA